MDRLLKIGFEVAGDWTLEADANRIRHNLQKHQQQRNILYAFVCNGEVMYVGKTTGTLALRMSGYRNPAPGSTNERINTAVICALHGEEVVEIYALPDSGLMHYGIFHLNLAAGLEDDIIRKLNPQWNGGRREQQPLEVVSSDPVEEVQQNPLAQFAVVIGPAYRRQGFFNMPARFGALLGADGENIELDFDKAVPPVLGTINRRCNGGDIPRVMGGVPVRNWFQTNFVEGESMSVEVLTPTSIRLRAAGTLG